MTWSSHYHTFWYYLHQLPISVTVPFSTVRCLLLVESVDYIFDLEEIEHEKLKITGVTEAKEF
jgi:hypothetical protein